MYSDATSNRFREFFAPVKSADKFTKITRSILSLATHDGKRSSFFLSRPLVGFPAVYNERTTSDRRLCPVRD